MENVRSAGLLRVRLVMGGLPIDLLLERELLFVDEDVYTDVVALLAELVTAWLAHIGDGDDLMRGSGHESDLPDDSLRRM